MRINNLGISENKRVANINQITPNENKTQGRKEKADGTSTAVKRYMHNSLYNFARKNTGKLEHVYFNGKKH